MALPVTFATLPAGNEPLSLIDQQFAALGALTTIPCTASGQNAVVLTPAANTPTINAYTPEAPRFGWTQAQTSTGAVTLQLTGGLAALNAYKNNGQSAVGSSDLVAGASYTAYFLSTLNAGAGGFVVDVVPTALVAPGAVQGAFKNLFVSNTTATAAAHQITITADSIALFDGSTTYATALAVNVTVDANTSGAGGIDTGTFAATTWYAVYLIQNTISGTVVGLISTSFTAPALPIGYARFARVGSARSNATPAFVNFIQKGRRVQYAPGTYNSNALAQLPQLTSGSTGTINTTTFTGTSTAWSAVAPTTACRIALIFGAQGQAATLALAPNANYSGYESATNPVPFVCLATGDMRYAEFELESANVYYASSTAFGIVNTLGYEDNL